MGFFIVFITKKVFYKAHIIFLKRYLTFKVAPMCSKAHIIKNSGHWRIAGQAAVVDVLLVMLVAWLLQEFLRLLGLWFLGLLLLPNFAIRTLLLPNLPD